MTRRASGLVTSAKDDAMTTAYEASVRLAFWGDSLEPGNLLTSLKLTESVCETKVKGQVLRKPDGTASGSVAKTGRLIYNCDKEFEDQRHDPAAQLERVANVLRPLPDVFFTSNGVEEAELQMSFYYEKTSAGEPDFFVPSDLVALAARHGIRVRITILP